MAVANSEYRWTVKTVSPRTVKCTGKDGSKYDADLKEVIFNEDARPMTFWGNKTNAAEFENIWPGSMVLIVGSIVATTKTFKEVVTPILEIVKGGIWRVIIVGQAPPPPAAAIPVAPTPTVDYPVMTQITPQATAIINSVPLKQKTEAEKDAYWAANDRKIEARNEKFVNDFADILVKFLDIFQKKIDSLAHIMQGVQKPTPGYPDFAGSLEVTEEDLLSGPDHEYIPMQKADPLAKFMEGKKE